MGNLRIRPSPEARLIHELKPYEFNNRNHSEEQIKHIADSIREFGFNQSLVIDEGDNILVGHGRWYAAQHLKMLEVPCVKVTDLTEQQKRAYRILDNKIQNDSTWSFNNLELELGWLEDNEFNLEFCGLGELKSLFPEDEPEVEEDEAPAVSEDEPYIKLGDLIELGRHRVVCGDYLEENALSGAIYDLVFTDPPYGMSLDVDFDSMFSGDASHKNVGKRYEPVTGDGEYFSPKYLLDKYESVPEIILFGGDYFCKDLPVDGSWFCWDKRVNEQMDKVVGNCFELAWSKRRHKKEVARIMWSGHHGLDTKKRVHPTQKPIKLVGWFFERIRGDFVYDPFLGSGTTLIACEQLGRTCHGTEIEPKYCQVIIERYRNHCVKHDKPFECRINGEVFEGYK